MRYIDEPNPKVKKECTSYFKRINLFDYFVKVANLDAIERCFIIGSIHVMDEAFVNDVINTDYRRFVECLALCAKFKLPYYGKKTISLIISLYKSIKNNINITLFLSLFF